MHNEWNVPGYPVDNGRSKIFEGLKVLEIASVLAGPAVGMFFAELGASVIKIENKVTGGDVTRTWKLASEPAGNAESAYYNSTNWGKRSLMLDLNTKNDRIRFNRLLAGADVLIANFKKGSAAKLGLDAATLCKMFPELIYANITAYGEDDESPGYDVLLQAETGFLHMTGHPEGPPAKMPVALIDIMAAHQVKEAVLIALLERGRTGKGAFIAVPLVKSAVAALANQASNYLNAGLVPGRMGSKHPNIAPYGEIFRTADGREIVLAVGSDAQFRGLCSSIGSDELADDERFSRNSARVAHREALNGLLEAAVAKLDFDDLLQALREKGVPAGAIRDMKQVFELETARSMILENSNGSKCVRTVAFEIHPT